MHAFYLEILKSREISQESSICQTRLLWWQDTLSDVEAGKKMQEPIGVAIRAALDETRINFDLLRRLVSYQLFDIDRGEMKTMKELDIYGENTRSLLMYLNLHMLNIDSFEANMAASHVGRCYGIVDVMKKMKYYLSKNRQYVPADILIKHGLYFDRIWKPNREGIVNEEF